MPNLGNHSCQVVLVGYLNWPLARGIGLTQIKLKKDWNHVICQLHLPNHNDWINK